MRKYRISIRVFSILIILSGLFGYYFKSQYIYFDNEQVEENNLDFDMSLIISLEEINNNIDDYLNFTLNSQVILKVKLIEKTVISENVFSKLKVLENYTEFSEIKVGDEINLLENYTIVRSDDIFYEYSNSLNLPIYKDNTYIINITTSDINDIYKYRYNSFSCYEVAQDKLIMEVSNEIVISKTEKSEIKFISELDTGNFTEDFVSFFGIDNLDEFEFDLNTVSESALKMYKDFENID